MIMSTVLAVSAFGLFLCGLNSGGWAVELGRVYYLYGIYVLLDVVQRLARGDK